MATRRDLRQGPELVGRSVPRSDGPEKVVGKARYADDYRPAATLYGATVRSPRPHIRIKSIDATRALAVPGVVRVVTAADIPGQNFWPLVLGDHPVLADGVARFAGEAVALVAAESQDVARRAAELVTIDYDELPAVFDPLEAMKPDAPLVFAASPDGTNVFRKFDVVKGDVDRGFAEADVILEQTYRTGYQVQGYLEPQGMIAEPGEDGSMLVHGSMQCPFYVHDAVSTALGLPQAKVQIVQRTTGGGFGGKEDVPSVVATHAALLAHTTGRPVKLIYTREEDFVSMSKRHPGWARVKLGAKKDGTLTAIQVKYVLDGGAYATLSPVVLFRGTVHAAGAYRVPHVKIESYAVATNKVPCGAFRGFGQPQICFAQESIVDEMADALGIDPFDLRAKNALRPGDTTATGQLIGESCGFGEVMAKVRAASRWNELRRAGGERSAGGRRVKGIGVSCNHYGVGLGAGGKYIDRSGASVQVQKDGSVLVAVGNTEIGQGARTVLGQIAAEGLGAPYEAVRVVEVDTTRVPDSGPTVASRTTLVAGNAILDACRKIRARLDEIRREHPEWSFAEIAKEAYARKLQAAEHGWWVSPLTSFSPSDGQGDAYVVFTWSCNVAEVEVDLETGEIRVERITSGHDIGKAINPQQAEGQIEGGVAQAAGYATIEHLVVDDGRLKNNNFTGYILATSSDAPEIVPIIVEHPYSGGPFGAKGLAESPIVGPAPAIANAVANAIGRRVRELPMVPERVWSAMNKREPG
jgi:CO/xanthine dehydrogenase Mo-binding subunit